MDFVGGINGEPIRLDQSRLSIILSCYNVDILLVSFISFSDIFLLEYSSQHLLNYNQDIVVVKNSFRILKGFEELFLRIFNFQNFLQILTNAFNFLQCWILEIFNSLPKHWIFRALKSLKKSSMNTF